MLASDAWAMDLTAPMNTSQDNHGEKRKADDEPKKEDGSPETPPRKRQKPTPRTPDGKSASAQEIIDLCQSPTRLKPLTTPDSKDAATASPKKTILASPQRRSPGKKKESVDASAASREYKDPSTIDEGAWFLLDALCNKDQSLDEWFLNVEKAILKLLEKEKPTQTISQCQKMIADHILLREVPDRLYNQTFKSFAIAPHIFKNKYWRELRNCAIDLAWIKLRENVLHAVASLDKALFNGISAKYDGIDYEPMPVDEKEASGVYKLLKEYTERLQIKAPIQVQVVWNDDLTWRDAGIQQTATGYAITIHINFLWYRNFEKDGFEVLNNHFYNEENFKALMAHEIAHIIVNFKTSDAFEREYYADMFAALLTSPETVIQHLKSYLNISTILLKNNPGFFYEINGQDTPQMRAVHHHPPLPARIAYVQTLSDNPQAVYKDFKQKFGNSVDIDTLFAPYLAKASATAAS